MKNKSKQTVFAGQTLKQKLSFGGDLLKKAANRHARPVSSKDTMHIVLKSSKAKGRFSFRHSQNAIKIFSAIQVCADKHGFAL